MASQNHKNDTVCFTGHRKIDYKAAVCIPSELKKLLEKLILQGACHFRVGGAMGFDTIAALCVLELQEQYPHVTLELFLPCKNQTAGWDKNSINAYNYILSKASFVKYISQEYNNRCMMERNRQLVDGSQICIAYLTESRGGTAYTFNYALQKNLLVINLAERIQKKIKK